MKIATATTIISKTDFWNVTPCIPLDLKHFCIDFVGIIMKSNILTESEQVDLYTLLIPQFQRRYTNMNTINFELLYGCYNCNNSNSDFNICEYNSKCIEQSNTLILILNEFGNVFGGFASKGIPKPQNKWISNETDIARMDEFSFLFRLKDNTNTQLEPQIFGLKNNDRYKEAMTASCDCIASFGYCDLTILLKCYIPMIVYPAKKIDTCIVSPSVYDFKVKELIGNTLDNNDNYNIACCKVQSIEIFKFYD